MGRKAFSRACRNWARAMSWGKVPWPDLRALPHSTCLRMTSSNSCARSVGSGGSVGVCGSEGVPYVVWFGTKVKLFP